MARRRAADLEGARAYSRAHYHKNHEINKAKMLAYYGRRFFWARATKLRGKGPRATPHELAALWHRQRGTCALTGRRLDRSAHLDHIIPLADRGGDEIGNLRWVCWEANLAKRALSDSAFLALCRDVVRTAA